MHPPGPATLVWLWHSPRKRVELQPGAGAEAEQAARADAAGMAAQVQETVAAVRRLEGHLDPSSELARLGRRYRAAAEAHGAAHAAWSVVASEGAAHHRGAVGGSPSTVQLPGFPCLENWMAHLDEARRAGYVEPLLTQIARATSRHAREKFIEAAGPTTSWHQWRSSSPLTQIAMTRKSVSRASVVWGSASILTLECRRRVRKLPVRLSHM